MSKLERRFPLKKIVVHLATALALFVVVSCASTPPRLIPPQQPEVPAPDADLARAKDLQQKVDTWHLGDYDAEDYAAANKDLQAGQDSYGIDNAAAEKSLRLAIAGYGSVLSKGGQAFLARSQEEADTSKKAADEQKASVAVKDDYAAANDVYQKALTEKDVRDIENAAKDFDSARDLFAKLARAARQARALVENRVNQVRDARELALAAGADRIELELFSAAASDEQHASAEEVIGNYGDAYNLQGQALDDYARATTAALQTNKSNQAAADEALTMASSLIGLIDKYQLVHVAEQQYKAGTEAMSAGRGSIGTDEAEALRNFHEAGLDFTAVVEAGLQLKLDDVRKARDKAEGSQQLAPDLYKRAQKFYSRGLREKGNYSAAFDALSVALEEFGKILAMGVGPISHSMMLVYYAPPVFYYEDTQWVVAWVGDSGVLQKIVDEYARLSGERLGSNANGLFKVSPFSLQAGRGLSLVADNADLVRVLDGTSDETGKEIVKKIDPAGTHWEWRVTSLKPQFHHVALLLRAGNGDDFQVLRASTDVHPVQYFINTLTLWRLLFLAVATVLLTVGGVLFLLIRRRNKLEISYEEIEEKEETTVVPNEMINCDNVESVTREYEINQSLESALTVESQVVQTASLNILLPKLRGALERKISERRQKVLTEQNGIRDIHKLTIRPKSKLVLTVTWKRTWQYGIQHVRRKHGKIDLKLPYRGLLAASYDQTKSSQTEC